VIKLQSVKCVSHWDSALSCVHVLRWQQSSIVWHSAASAAASASPGSLYFDAISSSCIDLHRQRSAASVHSVDEVSRASLLWQCTRDCTQELVLTNATSATGHFRRQQPCVSTLTVTPTITHTYARPAGSTLLSRRRWPVTWGSTRDRNLSTVSNVDVRLDSAVIWSSTSC